MINNTLMVVLMIIIPLLAIVLIYFLYGTYINLNKRNIIVSMLSDSSNQILEENKKKTKVYKENISFLATKLRFAGYDNSYAEYVFMFISIAFGILMGFFLYIVMGSPIAFIVGVLIFAFIPYLVLTKVIANRQEEFNFGLKSIIDKVTSMMKSGVGFEQAFKKSILTNRSQLTKDIFGIYINEKDIVGEDKVFERIFEKVESKELRIFYLVIKIGRQSGGKFSNTLETLRKTLHDQGTIKQEITSSTKEIKMGTYMIILLTIGMYMMMNSVFEDALNQHFFGSDDGKLQMFFIILWVSFGIFINNMMTKIKE